MSTAESATAAPCTHAICTPGRSATPCKVGAYAAGPFGLHDLAGNVLQWTTTTNDVTGTFRGGRGGSWKDTVPEAVKNSHRNGFKNTYRCGFLGVRCSTAIPATPPAATPAPASPAP